MVRLEATSTSHPSDVILIVWSRIWLCLLSGSVSKESRRPDATSHTRADLTEVEMMRVPSPENATDCIEPSLPRKAMGSSVPDCVSQTRIDWPYEPETIRNPQGENAIDETWHPMMRPRCEWFHPLNPKKPLCRRQHRNYGQDRWMRLESAIGLNVGKRR
jgi:hypothetical protein